MLGSLATLPLPARLQGTALGGNKIDADQSWLFDEFRIEVPFSRIGRLPLRHFPISAQLYNSIADYDALADAIDELTASGAAR